MLENKLGIKNAIELAKEEEKITKLKALNLFETKKSEEFEVGTFTDKVDDRKVYMKGIDASYSYEGYSVYNWKD